MCPYNPLPEHLINRSSSIHAYLRKHGPSTIQELADALGMKYMTVSGWLWNEGWNGGKWMQTHDKKWMIPTDNTKPVTMDVPADLVPHAKAVIEYYHQEMRSA